MHSNTVTRLFIFVLVLTTGCTSVLPMDNDVSTASVETSEVQASVRLVVEPKQIGPGQRVSIVMENTGEVDLFTGLDFTVERWDGRRWRHVSSPDAPAVGIVLRPGESTAPEHEAWWPSAFDDEPLESGNYRILKTATYEPQDGAAREDDKQLAVRARFEVRPR